MLKTVFKVIFMFIITIVVAIASAAASYIITKNSLENRMREDLADTAVKASVQSTVKVPQAEKSTGTAEFDCYIVRLEGESLSVYVSFGGKEEFLYTENIYKNDLTHEDISMLSTGVRLESSEELTGFIENFTS